LIIIFGLVISDEQNNEISWDLLLNVCPTACPALHPMVIGEIEF
jgi:hypothetical protein